MSLIQLGLMLLTHPTRLRAGHDSFWHNVEVPTGAPHGCFRGL
jgi:hypothetical protein